MENKTALYRVKWYGNAAPGFTGPVRLPKAQAKRLAKLNGGRLTLERIRNHRNYDTTD